MTIGVVTRLVSYSGNDTAGPFNVPFQFFELAVYQDGSPLTEGVEYYVDQAATGQTGDVYFNPTYFPSAINDIDIFGDTDLAQQLDLIGDDEFDAENVELSLDRLYAAMQEVKSVVSKSLRTSIFNADVAELDMEGNPETLIYIDGTGLPTLVDVDTALNGAVSTAAASASAASVSAAAALVSETNAASSESAAAVSETNAAASETAAATSASNSSTSETNAAASEAAASTSETNAAASQVAASTSASNASTSETNAAASESAAATSETNAATSETNAGTSETNSANNVTYSAEWANKAEDSLISVAAGGDNVDDYSALHWSNKAAASAAAAAASAASAPSLGDNEIVTGDWEYQGTTTYTGDITVSGVVTASHDEGTKTTGTFTPTPTSGNIKHFINGGAFTLGVHTAPCTLILEMTNNASAGAVDTTAFTLVDGDTLTTTDGHRFVLQITITENASRLSVSAYQ